MDLNSIFEIKELNAYYDFSKKSKKQALKDISKLRACKCDLFDNLDHSYGIKHNCKAYNQRPSK